MPILPLIADALRRFAPLFLLAFLLPPPVLAWNAGGHRLVAHIAWQQLAPKTREEVSRLLRAHPEHGRWLKRAKESDPELAAFVECSTWADEIRKDERFYDKGKGEATPTLPGYPDMERRRNWHYVLLPSAPIPENPPKSGQLAQQLPRLGDALASRKTTDAERTYALPWLVHLVGEAHQPLHVSLRYDAESGWDLLGNQVKVNNLFNRAKAQMTLHEFWDDLPGPRWLRGDALATASRTLVNTYPAPPASGDSATWIAESQQIARLYAYPAKAPEISSEFFKESREIANRRITEAGYRLADLLNQLLLRRNSAP